MPNMYSSTSDSSEHQNRYLEKHNQVECFFKTLSTKNREIKHSIILQWFSQMLVFLMFLFFSFEKFYFFLTLQLAQQLLRIPFCEKGDPIQHRNEFHNSAKSF